MGFWGKVGDFVMMRNVDKRAMQMKSASGMVPRFQLGKPTWWDDSIPVLTRDAYRKTATAFACINIIADAVAEASLKVVLDSGPGDKEELPEHPLRQLLRHPNPSFSESEFIAQMVRMSAISGFVVVEKMRSSRSNVVQLGFLRPDWISPILREQAPPDWWYKVPGEPGFTIPAEDVVVFRYMDDALLSVTGDTPLRVILREAGIASDLRDFVKMMLERGGMPQIALVVDKPEDGEFQEKLTDDEREAVRQQFIAKYSGYQNWAGPAIIEGMTVQTVGLNLNDMAFKDLRDGLDLTVCQAFRVPAPVVQVMAGITQSYGKLLEESMTLLQDYTASPLRRRLDGALSRGLIHEFDNRMGIDLVFDTSEVKALQEDADAVHTRAQKDFDAGGITWDEFRAAIGLEPWNNPLGNSVKLPFTTVPMSVKSKGVSPARPTSDDEPDPEDERFEVRNGQLFINQERLSEAERAVRAQADATHQQLIILASQRIQGDIKTYLEAQADRVLSAYVTGNAFARNKPLEKIVRAGMDQPGSLDYRAVDPVDWLGENELLKEVLRVWWQVTAEEGAASASLLMGVDPDWDGNNPFLHTLEDVLAKQVVQISEKTARDIEELVLNGIVDGKNDVQIATDIADLFDMTYANRHVTIARTEAMHAANLGAELQYSQSGHVDQVEMRDNPQCDHTRGADGLTCAERHGMVIPVTDMSKHTAGEHPNGSLGYLPILNKPLGEV